MFLGNPEFNELMKLFDTSDLFTWKTQTRNRPYSHVQEDDGTYKIVVLVPGCGKEDLELSVENKMLKIKFDENNIVRYGLVNFKYEKLDEDSFEATVDKGVLTFRYRYLSTVNTSRSTIVKIK